METIRCRKLIHGWDIGDVDVQCQCDLGVTFDIGSARMFSTAIFETPFSSHKVIWIAATDYHIYLLALSPS